MREILKEEIINIPEGVTIIKKKNREFIVKGPKGCFLATQHLINLRTSAS